MPKTPVIIDCDPGHDDAMALMLALASPELEVVAVTTVAGNQTLDKVTANAIRVLDVVGATTCRSPPARTARSIHTRPRVADEVHGETGLDGPDLPPPSRDPEPIHAVELMARELRKRPLTLIPVGPLTNIALLIAMYPDLVENIEDIVVMGGAIGLGNVTPSAEFNLWCDPEAAKRVFESDADVTHDRPRRHASGDAQRRARPRRCVRRVTPARWSPTFTPSTGGFTWRSMGMTTPQCTMPSPSPT